jgi:hypothetical protein
MKQEVSMHYSIEKGTSLQYTDDPKKATVICVHTQSYKTDCETYTHGSRSGEFDIIDERLFPNTTKGMKSAEKYAEQLCLKYKNHQNCYELY